MVSCPRCGRGNDGKYRFCLGCGAALAAQEPRSTQPVPSASPSPAGTGPIGAPPPAVRPDLVQPARSTGAMAPPPPPPPRPTPPAQPAARPAADGGAARVVELPPRPAVVHRSASPPPIPYGLDDGDAATLSLPPVQPSQVGRSTDLASGNVRRVPRGPSAGLDLSEPPPIPIDGSSIPTPNIGHPGSSGFTRPRPAARAPIPPPPASSNLPRTAAPITSPRPVPAPPAPPAPPCDSCGTPVPHANSFCGKCGATNPNHTPTLPIQHGAVAPRPDRVGTIALIDDSGAESTQFPLVLGENRIGRSEACHLRFPDDGFLAAVHCIVDADPSRFVLRTVDQANGTFLRITSPVEIHHGDVLRVGQEVLRFERIDRLEPERMPDGEPQMVGWPLPRGVWGRLCQIGLTRQVANAYLLASPDVFLGRERGDILFPKDGFVSGSHAVLSDRNGRVFLKDLGSSNGTFLRVPQESPLRNGDLFLLGRNLLRVHTGTA